MSVSLHVDPIVVVIDAVSDWAWHQVLDLSRTWMERFVFHPLLWPRVVTQLYDVSRDLSWSLVGIIVIFVALRSFWPQFTWPQSRLAVPAFLERLVVAALIDLAGSGVVESALKINNALVSALLGTGVAWTPMGVPSGALSPLAVLIASLAMAALMLYLALFYAVRTIEVYLLTAAIPWFALWWATRDDDEVLSNLSRELAVVIFVQTVHAGAFWLALRLMSATSLGVTGFFLELAVLWYMTRIPAQLRRMLGAGTGVTQLWR
jgi:hypothetical protein